MTRILTTLTTLAAVLILIAPIALGNTMNSDGDDPDYDSVVTPTGNDDNPLLCGAGRLDFWVDACGDKMYGDLEMLKNVVYVGGNGSHFPLGLIPAQDPDGPGANATLDSTGNDTLPFKGHPTLGFNDTVVCLEHVRFEGCGTITAVHPGWGLVGGGDAGDVTIGADPAVVQARVVDTCVEDHYMHAIQEDGTVLCRLDQDTTYSAGEGLDLDSTTFHANTTFLQARVVDTCVEDHYMHAIQEDGTVLCRLDQDTTYSAGSGLELDNTTFLADTSVVQARVIDTCTGTGYIQEILVDGTVQCEGGWATSGNTGTDPANDFIGTTDNVAFEVRVNDQRALRIEPGAVPNVIGGKSDNQVSAGVTGATIAGGSANRVTALNGAVGGGSGNKANGFSGTVGGGGANAASGAASTVGGGDSNMASGFAATISGGNSNTASGQYSTVGGGNLNTVFTQRSTVGGGASNQVSGLSGTVGGGFENEASGDESTVAGGESNFASAEKSTVGGGFSNTASGFVGTVGGGDRNSASGSWSTVPGGMQNEADGTSSFAAGQRAKADHAGTFIWRDADGSADFHSSAHNQFRVRSVGGVKFWTDTGLTTGCSLAAGGGSWSCTSDRDAKENWQEVDSKEVLERLVDVPVATWNYRSQEQDVVHMGPAAQDFYEAFGLGEGEKSISQVDSAGVAFAAIQGMAELMSEQDEKIQQQADELDQKEQTLQEQAEQIEDLEKRLQRLEALMGE